MFKRILVPLDGSARAEHAIPVAARVARAANAQIVLLRVVTPPVEYGGYMAPMPVYTQSVLEAEEEEARHYLTGLLNMPELAGMHTETQALPGLAATTILSFTERYSIDLIVMCSQGNTGLKRWVLGSIAQKIARYSPVPVFVLRETGIIPTDNKALRALVSLDGSALAKAALEPAAILVSALSAPGKGALHLVRVVKLPPVDNHPSDPLTREQALYKAKKYLLSVVDHLRTGPLASLNLSITWSVVFDTDAAHALTKAAEEGTSAHAPDTVAIGKSDFIAMATHGRGGLQRWALGSVTERVLSVVKLPLLIIRPQGTSAHNEIEDGEKTEAPIR